MAADDSKGVSHGDRVIAACVALQGMRDIAEVEYVATEDATAPLGTMARRLQDYEDSIRDTSDGWQFGMANG